MILWIKTFILREQNVEQIWWEQKSCCKDGEGKEKANKQGKVPVLKKSCTLLNPHTGFKNISWTVFKFSTQMLSSFAFTGSWDPYLFCSLWVFKKENEKGRKEESGKNQTTWKENSGLAQQQSDFFFPPQLSLSFPQGSLFFRNTGYIHRRPSKLHWMSSRTLCYNTCSISKPMIRPGNIEQLLNSFLILWSRTHLIRRHTDPLLQRQLDFPTNLTISPP